MGAHADYAYDQGITGKGVTIALIDTGIDVDSPEFAGRISPDSKSFSVMIARCMTCEGEEITFDLDDIQGHGTETAAIAAAAKDGNGIHGIAYDADILALKIVAPLLENVTADSPIPEGDSGQTSNIAPAITYAVDKGAFVISMSLNGTADGQMAAEQRAAMDHVRDNNRLFVESITNDVGVDSFGAGTIAENLVGKDLTNKDWFLFGIRVDENLNAAMGNGVPGKLADRTLAVVASNVQTIDADGKSVSVTGNSYAAPAIAGAAALLKQYWPQLGGKEISRILLDTAQDLGEAGTDQTYGVGLMRIDKAMQAQAPTLGTAATGNASVAGSALVFSPAFGSGSGSARFSGLAGKAVVLDRYGRDYNLDVASRIASTGSGGIRIAGLAAPQAMPWQAPPMNQAALLSLAGTDTSPHPVRAGTGAFAFRAGPDTIISGAVNSPIEGGTLLTGSMLRASGIATYGSRFGYAQGGYAIEIGTARQRWSDHGSSTQRVEVAIPSGIRFGLTTSQEKGSALGLQGSGAFAIGGARSTFASLGWAGALGGFSLHGEMMAGRTHVNSPSNMLRFDNAILSSGFTVEGEHRALGGRMHLGLTSPLRVERAALIYTSPVAYDRETASLVNQSQRLDLAPSAREMNLELGWTGAFARGFVGLGAAYGVNSDNVAGRSSAAAWMRLGSRF